LTGSTPNGSRVLAGLVTVTLLPSVLGIAHYHLIDDRPLWTAVPWLVIGVLGMEHIWVTGAFYLDQRWRELFGLRPIAYYVAPVGIVVASTAIALLAPPGVVTMLIIVPTFISLWHHARQNWGIYALVCRARNTMPTGRLLLQYAWLPFLWAWGLNFAVEKPGWAVELAWAFMVLWLCVAAVAAVRSLPRDAVAAIFFFAGVIWFTPLVTAHGTPLAFAAYGYAHGLQYYYLTLRSLGVAARQSSLRSLLLLIGGITALCAVGYAVEQYKHADDAAWPTLRSLAIGVFSGITLAHFFLDALLWRLSTPEIRRLHLPGLAFAFTAPPMTDRACAARAVRA
jgi:hypothetical protein